MFYDNYLFAVLQEMERPTWHSQLHGLPNVQNSLQTALPTELSILCPAMYVCYTKYTSANPPRELTKNSAVIPDLKTYTVLHQ